MEYTKKVMQRSSLIALIALLVVVVGIWYYESGNPLHYNPSGSGPIFTVASSSGQTYLTVTADGKVGIGTEHPNTTLEVAGPIRLTKKSEEGCDLNTTGEIAYNPDNRHFWGCDGSAWLQLDTP